MKHPNKVYIHRVFSKTDFSKNCEFDEYEYTWPDLCEGQRVYIYEGEDSSQLYVMGKDDKEYFCLYCWTEPEI